MRLAGALAGIALGWAAGLGVAVAAPLEAYGKLPTLEAVEISPDGTMIAFVATTGDARRIIIQKLADNSLVASLEVGNQKVRSLQWAGSGHLLITASSTNFALNVSSGREEFFTTLNFNLRTRKQENLLARAQSTTNVVASNPTVRVVDGHPFAFVEGIYFGNSNTGARMLFKVSIESNEIADMESAARGVEGWAIDDQGKVVAQSLYEEATGKWSLRTKQKGAWTPIRSTSALLDQPSLLGMGRDEKTFVVREKDKENEVYREIAADGTATDLPDFDGLLRDPKTHLVIGGERDHADKLDYEFFDPADAAAWRGIVKAYPGQMVNLASWSDDHRKWVVLVDGPTDGAAYALIDLDAHKAAWIGDLYEG